MAEQERASMSETTWPEAANRRLRPLLWKGWISLEMSASLALSTADILGQMRRLGLSLTRAI
jgi:hypothetical protein